MSNSMAKSEREICEENSRLKDEIFTLKESLKASAHVSNSFEKKLQDLEKAITYARAFYYLPQNVLDLFAVLVPDKHEVTGAFYNEIMARDME